VQSGTTATFTFVPPLDDLLFCSGDLGAALEAIRRSMTEEIGKAQEDHVLHVDEHEWATALADRYSVEAPVLQSDKVWMDPPQDIQVDVSWDHFNRAIFDPSTPTYIPGYRVVVHVPFSGDKGVFEQRARTFSMNPPRAEVRPGELRKHFEYPHDRPANIKAETDQLISAVEQHLTWARGDIEAHNQRLHQEARAAITNRRERVLKHHEHLAETGLPMQRPDDGPKTYIADAIVRRPAPVLPSMPASQPMPLEPVLADDVFEHILSVVRSVGQDMERSPKTYAAMGEEDLRQVLLAALNTHYAGQTVAEAFNVSGKTDLMIRHEGNNLFIGECKFWSGPKGFTDTIDQLFGYQAWRDTKLVIVMFVREKNLTQVITRASDALREHPQFVAEHVTASETELRATVSWAGDESRHADLAVFFVHIPE
jgi:hypothetical protein